MRKNPIFFSFPFLSNNIYICLQIIAFHRPLESSLYSLNFIFSLPEACLLPKTVGSCNEKIPLWYYDAGSESCESFTYGGCLGNNNRFVTKEACEQKCINLNVCELSKDEGPCDKPTIQWYYNKENSRCEQFYYGGCKGNANRFETRRECEKSCVASVVHGIH
ncbi:unnamed protein product [Larinioides sclopetarius]|uniref:BPTI/Kunitz inhibitor domain-containing protein n=1 Tax=Larinioides sclopetarius TaxID=280406 RepID=A0AAV1Z985_9ARAC